jgi:hypothetical protein
MKVYNETPEIVTIASEEMISAIIQRIPLDMAPAMRSFLERYNELQEEYAQVTFEKFRYKAMWALRTIESEIEGEGGIFVIREEGNVETKGFSQALTDKIRELLNNNYK